MPTYLIDPPEGHRFGFPKAFTGNPATLDFSAWLLQQGYPAALLARYPSGHPCRIIGPLDADAETGNAAAVAKVGGAS